MRNHSHLKGWLLSGVFAAVVPSLAAAQTKLTNTLKLDVGGPIALNLFYIDTKYSGNLKLPVLLGYERQLGKHTSLAGEGLVNGGDLFEKSSGLSVHGRCYFLQPGRSFRRHEAGTLGTYVALATGYRAIEQTINYNYLDEAKTRSRLLGGGLLLGSQVGLGQQQRVVVDLNVGYMAWRRIWDDGQFDGSIRTYRETDFAVPDVRLSVGYRF